MRPRQQTQWFKPPLVTQVMHIAAVTAITTQLLPALEHLHVSPHGGLPCKAQPLQLHIFCILDATLTLSGVQPINGRRVGCTDGKVAGV